MATTTTKLSITALATALGAVAVSFFQQNGFPATKTAWTVLAITLIGNLLVYLGKNLVFPSLSSTSFLGHVSVTDLISGLVLAIGSGIISFAAAAITATAIDWNLLLHTAAGVAGSYLAVKFGLGAPAPTTPVSATPTTTPAPVQQVQDSGDTPPVPPIKPE